MLLNDFFQIKDVAGGETESVYRIWLNADHPVYRAHFQGNPITPGACIIQMLKEIAEVHFEKSFFVRNAKNVKFLIAINPVVHAEVDVHINSKTDENGHVAVSAIIDNEKTIFCKANLVLEDRDDNPNLLGKGQGDRTEAVLHERFEQLRLCVVIPTYNNEKTLAQTLNDVLTYTNSVIVVNDGATDGTGWILESFAGRIEVVGYAQNRGKGHALRCGFDRAEALGYQAAITLDSDGQHFASDLEAFVHEAETNPDALLMGQRRIEGHISSGSSFANKFSNFWFAVQTGRRLHDTQNGFRLYPLSAMKGLRPLSSRYEAELEMLVRSAWKGIQIRPVPVHVYYPPEEERVSHFRPGKDFLRISLLNTLFTFLAILYGYPSMLCHKVQCAMFNVQCSKNFLKRR